jgi:hypothetical protein
VAEHVFEPLDLLWWCVRPTRVVLEGGSNRRILIGPPSPLQTRIVASAAAD